MLTTVMLGGATGATSAFTAPLLGVAGGGGCRCEVSACGGAGRWWGGGGVGALDGSSWDDVEGSPPGAGAGTGVGKGTGLVGAELLWFFFLCVVVVVGACRRSCFVMP